MQCVSPNEQTGDSQQGLQFHSSTSTLSPTLPVPTVSVVESGLLFAHLPTPPQANESNIDAYTSILRKPLPQTPPSGYNRPDHLLDKQHIFDDSGFPSHSHTLTVLDSGPSDSGFTTNENTPPVLPKTMAPELLPMSISVTKDIQDMVNSPTLPDVTLLQTINTLSALRTDLCGHHTSCSFPKNENKNPTSTPATASTLIDFSTFNASGIMSSNNINESAPIAFKIPPVSTYAEATNLAARFPEHASEILVRPLASIHLERPNADKKVCRSHSFGAKKGSSHAPLLSHNDSHMPSSMSTEGPEHSSFQPNWARAPSPERTKTSLNTDTRRKRGRNEREGNDAKRRRSDDFSQPWGGKDPPARNGRATFPAFVDVGALNTRPEQGQHARSLEVPLLSSSAKDRRPFLIQAPYMDRKDLLDAYPLLGRHVPSSCVGSPCSFPCGEATQEEADIAALSLLFQESVNIQHKQRDNDVEAKRIGPRPLDMEHDQKPMSVVAWQMGCEEKDSKFAGTNSLEIASILQKWRIGQGGLDMETRHRQDHVLRSASAVNPSYAGPTRDPTHSRSSFLTGKHPHDTSSSRLYGRNPNRTSAIVYNDITNELERVSSVLRGGSFGCTGSTSTRALPVDAAGYENFILSEERAEMVAPVVRPAHWGGNEFRQHHHILGRPLIEPVARLNHEDTGGTGSGEDFGVDDEWV